MKFKMSLACYGALQATLAATQVAWAQSVPFNTGGALRQLEEAEKPPLSAAPAVPVLPKLVEPQLALKGNETLFVRTINVEGPDLGAGAEVGKILAPYENRTLNLAAIYEAADKITTLYRVKGYILAKAYVPAQDARSGVLKFKLVPGEYGTFAVKNESRVMDPLVQQAVEQARSTSPYIQKDDLERAMLLTSDLAGAGVPRVVTAAGQQPGTSDLAFDVPPTRPIDGYLLGDNYGAPWTGRNELSGAVNVNSPFGLGDKLSVWGLLSEDAGLKNGRVAYSLPLGASGVKTEIAVFHTNYALGGTFAGLDATGTADGVSATLSYALQRSVGQSWYISGSYTHKTANDNAFGFSVNQRTIDLGTLTLTRDTAGMVVGLPLTTNAILSYTEGHVDITDAGQLQANILGVDTAGYYSRVNLSYLATLGLTDKLSFSTYIRGQKALFEKSLDLTEQFYLTGFFGVRSFDQGFSGDSGYLVTPELKYALPEIPNYHHAIGVFTDVGGVQLENAQFFTATQKEFTQLNDVGAAYYATYDYMPNRSVLLKAQVAHTYGAVGLGATLYNKGTKGLLQVGFTF
jgi:hemolysin activation/secretion protein